MPTSLIIDDDDAFTPALAALMRARGYSVTVASTFVEGHKLLTDIAPDIALIDMALPDGSGIDLLSLANRSRTRAVLMTAFSSVETAITAFHRDAWDYLPKPFDAARLDECLAGEGGAQSRHPTNARLDDTGATSASGTRTSDAPLSAEDADATAALIGDSPAMRGLRDEVLRVGPLEMTALLIGETGTGKELVAAAIHAASARRGQALITINCGAVAPELISTELFGHERGSFTGAGKQRKGVFELADGGTLFLDEVTEMPLELQVNLLRVLESGTFRRVGGEQDFETNVRLIAATNRDPAEAVENGKLRSDLYYRLNAFPVDLPPLRERHGDVELLARHFVSKLNQRHGKGKQLSQEAVEALEGHTWQGNVRELLHAVERAWVMADQEIEARHFRLASLESSDSPYDLTFTVGTTVQEMEQQLVVLTLERCNGHKPRAAKLLGISLKTLYNKLNRYAGRA